VTGRWRALLVALALGAACAHAKTTDQGSEKQAEETEKAGQKEAQPRAGGKQGSTLHPGNPDAVPVATAPDALLAPGAEREIRERLISGGFLAADADKSNGATRAAIRKFQKAQDLPATGVPDAETVKRLGLDPDKTFRRGTVKD
jgi:peptidoglycan hydrolase-like protein with peptidoglycan-binding domain